MDDGESEDVKRESPFKIGDTVQLKSGGHVMTVLYSNEWKSGCVWLDAYGREHRKEFPNDALRAAQPKA
jgi:uncharacterized protein YodC (DUF2158 family)